MTPREIQQQRRKGATDIVSESGSKPPPEMGVDPRLEGAFPEQAKLIRKFNEDLRQWWRDSAVVQKA